MADWSERYSYRGYGRYGQRDEGIGQKIENWVEEHFPSAREQETGHSGSGDAYDTEGTARGIQAILEARQITTPADMALRSEQIG
jgi:hypothetical protein